MNVQKHLLTNQLSEPTIISVLQDCIKTARDAWTNTGFPLVLVGTVEDSDKLPLGLVGLFKDELLIEVRPAFATSVQKLIQ